MKKQFRKGQLVFDHGSKRKGKFVSYNRDMGKTATVEFITSFNKETQERTTKLETVQTSNLEYARQNKKRKPLPIKIKYFDKEVAKIEKIEQGDWIDLRAAETVEMKQGDFKVIKLGVGMKLPKGFEAHVVPRSSTFKKWGVLQTNSMGVIDESYCGNEDQWRFPALAMRDTRIEKGDRICQFRIMRKMSDVYLREVENLNDVSRGGFGSTGHN